MWQEWMDEYNKIVYGEKYQEKIDEFMETQKIINDINQNGSLFQKIRLWFILKLGI